MRRILRILVLDDCEDEVHTLLGALAQCSRPRLNIEYTGQLSAGLDRLCAVRVDAVILKAPLQEHVTTEVLQEIQSLSPNTAIILFVALDDESFAIKSLVRGAQDYWVRNEDLDPAKLERSLLTAHARKRAQKLTNRRLHELEDVLNSIHVKVLQPSIVLCAICKRVERDAGDWVAMSTYLKNHQESPLLRAFVPGLCPICQAQQEYSPQH